MMNRKLILSVVLWTVTMPLLAQPVDRMRALEKAQRFMHDKGYSFSVRQPLQRAQEQQQPYYIFHSDNGQGFVIVSGEESAPAIIGYSTVGKFDEQNMPPALQAWLNDYADRVSYVQQNHLSFSHRAAGNLGTPIKNATAKWNQTPPFNQQCPEVEAFADSKCTTPYTNNGKTYEKNIAAAGCMAVALSIIMKYHQYPKATTAEIPARMNHVYETQDYSDPNNPVTIWERFSDPAIPAGAALEWDKVIDDYYVRDETGYFTPDEQGQPKQTGTNEQKQAVAKLMRIVASAIGMQYGLGEIVGSSTNSAAMLDGARKYLGFHNATLHTESSYASAQEFQQALYNELKAAGAVFFSAQSKEGGHSMVIDGYSTEDFFSINWGWGGYCDGNYRLSSPNPESQGEKIEKGAGYTEDQEFVSGLYADTPTAVVGVKDALRSHSGKAYNLQGQQVAGDAHGIVIMNGKKVVKKR